MQIDVKGIPPGGRTYEGSLPAEVVDLGDAGDPVVEGPLAYRVRAEVAGMELCVRGALELPVRFRCSRCAETFGDTVRAADFFCARDLREGVKAGAEAAQFVDLTPDMRESILLAFPSHPVCRSDCKGLCPQCGANRNEEACDCVAPGMSDWTMLDGLDLRD
jgi:uncharacterized metal-binding protein YceD (DUF177 family)